MESDSCDGDCDFENFHGRMVVIIWHICTV